MRDGYRTKSLERVLPTVQKPGRYVGGEYNSVVKDWDAVSTRVCLAYPDIYDLGMSGLGRAILYHTLNALPDVLAERTYLPWTDMIAAMRATGIPLYSDNEATLLEAALSRGDRRLGRIIERAWELGARFDAWDELRQVSAWTRAFAEAGLSPEFYAHRQRAHDEIFPWEVVSVGVSRAFLWREISAVCRARRWAIAASNTAIVVAYLAPTAICGLRAGAVHSPPVPKVSLNENAPLFC